jgi:toxin ParE1/3/4
MIHRTPQAQVETIEAAFFISMDSPSAGERFIDAVEATLAQLKGAPGIGRAMELPHSQLAGIRFWSVRGFPNHLIVYRPVDDGIEMLRLVHGARDLPSLLTEET